MNDFKSIRLQKIGVVSEQKTQQQKNDFLLENVFNLLKKFPLSSFKSIQ
jgi:hypothetical protein